MTPHSVRFGHGDEIFLEELDTSASYGNVCVCWSVPRGIASLAQLCIACTAYLGATTFMSRAPNLGPVFFFLRFMPGPAALYWPELL